MGLRRVRVGVLLHCCIILRRHALIAGCTHNLQDTPLFAGGQRGEGWALQACHTNHTLLALHRSGGRRGESWLPQALKARAVRQIGM